MSLTARQQGLRVRSRANPPGSMERLAGVLRELKKVLVEILEAGAHPKLAQILQSAVVAIDEVSDAWPTEKALIPTSKALLRDIEATVARFGVPRLPRLKRAGPITRISRTVGPLTKAEARRILEEVEDRPRSKRKPRSKAEEIASAVEGLPANRRH